ncbi:MAG TPA: hypothetical protein VHZ28_02555 [Terracidiphilus sp.]|jgi:hypothetical protein|nr:hypothetical protein [Terracidiphilus sp.]HEX4283945.1 hypothetical protein [Terracidiphilus sp.]
MHVALLLLQQSPIDPEQARKIAMMFLAVLPVIILVGYAVVILPCWFICKKAGFSPWLSLLNIVPFGSLILLYVLAFGEWKVTPAVPRPFDYPYPPSPPQR